MTGPPAATVDPTADLERWFGRQGRDLPWRRVREPWAILLSEVMLQQTQVDRIIERWPRFLDRFPTPRSMASAPVSAVIDEWSGLGYNRRAVNLHRCASAIVEQFGGQVPPDLAELLSLPGVGPYTARAVAVFAFEDSEAIVDTNVARILARVHNRELQRAEVQSLADRWVDGRDPWTWNQALLDVGALFCRPRNPGCDDCPLRVDCQWTEVRAVTDDPAIGSAGVSGRQSTFEGSDRQGRGRLVEALRDGDVTERRLADVMGWPDDRRRAQRVAGTLVADGLVEVDAGRYRLPS